MAFPVNYRGLPEYRLSTGPVFWDEESSYSDYLGKMESVYPKDELARLAREKYSDVIEYIIVER